MDIESLHKKYPDYWFNVEEEELAIYTKDLKGSDKLYVMNEIGRVWKDATKLKQEIEIIILLDKTY